MKKLMSMSDAHKFLAAIFLFASTLLMSCEESTPDAQIPSQGTTNPGSSTTTPGSSTTATTPGSSTTATTPGSSTTATTPGSSTTATTPVVVSVVDYVKGSGDLTFLAAAIQRAGLTADLNKGQLTVFAPTDAAFRAVGYADVNAVNAAPAADLQRILQYHAIGSRQDASSFATEVSTSYQTLLGDGQISVYKSRDGVVTVNKARITRADIPATNSVIHIIDQVLTPPTVSVVDLAKARPELSFLVAAVERAGIQAALTTKTANGITVFAPNNDAFKAAGYADEAAIRAADPKVLTDLLNYHVLNTRLFSSVLPNGADLGTAQGGTVRIAVNADKVTVTGKGNGTNAANVTQADLVATNNAVIHVIDRVLLPQ